LYKPSMVSNLFSTLAIDPKVTQVNLLVVIRTPYRESLIEHLDNHGISHAIHYPYLDTEQIGFVPKNQNLMNSEMLKYEILSIPVFPEMSEIEIQLVIEALHSFSLNLF